MSEQSKGELIASLICFLVFVLKSAVNFIYYSSFKSIPFTTCEPGYVRHSGKNDLVRFRH